MKYLFKLARLFGMIISIMVFLMALMMMEVIAVQARSQSDAQNSEVKENNRVNETTGAVNGTHALTSVVAGPPVGGLLIDAHHALTVTAAITLDIDAPWFTVSPYDETWGHWVRISNFDIVTRTALLAVVPVQEMGQPGLDNLEVHIAPIGTCVYNADHSEALCTFDVGPNRYWEIYLEYDLNSVANPPHWEIVQCINSGPRKCETTNVYFPFSYFAMIPLAFR